MFRPIKAIVSHINLSVTVTYEHVNSALSSTRLQLIGGSKEPREPSRSSPAVPGPTTPEDSRGWNRIDRGSTPGHAKTGATNHQVMGRTLASSPDWGPAPSASAPTAPSDTPLAPGSSQTGAPYRRVALLPSCVGLAGTSYTCGLGAFSTSGAYSSGTSVSWGVVTGHGELEATVVRSPALTVGNAARGKCEDVIRRAADQQTIRVVEVRRLPPKHHLLSPGDISRINGSDKKGGQLHTHTEMT
jgi:hypothetical protein